MSSYYPWTYLSWSKAVASLTIHVGKISTFLIFPQILLIFFLILALQVGKSPTREGPGYATELIPFGASTSKYKKSAFSM